MIAVVVFGRILRGGILPLRMPWLASLVLVVKRLASFTFGSPLMVCVGGSRTRTGEGGRLSGLKEDVKFVRELPMSSRARSPFRRTHSNVDHLVGQWGNVERSLNRFGGAESGIASAPRHFLPQHNAIIPPSRDYTPN